MNEIENLIPSFRSEVQAAIGSHRQWNGDFGTVEKFERDLVRHRTRYSQKLENIRILNAGRAQIIAQCDAAEAQIASITAAEIERARKTGKVEYA
jgi:predicted secreted Zn-dependent protease